MILFLLPPYVKQRNSEPRIGPAEETELDRVHGLRGGGEEIEQKSTGKVREGAQYAFSLPMIQEGSRKKKKTLKKINPVKSF